MATLRKRPGPGGRMVWQARVARKGYAKQYQTFNTKAQAERWARRVEEEMAGGGFLLNDEAKTTTLAQALARYQAEVSIRKRSADRERSTIAWWAQSRLSQRPLQSIRGKDVVDCINEDLATRLSPNSIRLYLALLSHVFNTASTSWGMETLKNPVELAKGQRPKLPSGRDRRLTCDHEVVALHKAATEYGGQMDAIITFAIETAMRRGEIAAMQWEHFESGRPILRVPDTKTGTPRRIPLSPAAMAALPTRTETGAVWDMKANSISQAFERICKKAGLKDLRFHDLRHEAASRLSDQRKLDVMQIAAITGHRSMQMLKRYTHPRAEDMLRHLGWKDSAQPSPNPLPSQNVSDRSKKPTKEPKSSVRSKT